MRKIHIAVLKEQFASKIYTCIECKKKESLKVALALNITGGKGNAYFADEIL